MVPAATCSLNSSGLNPAPTFLCSGSRRFDASTMRVTLTESTRCAAAPKVSTSLSITKPGFTPVPTRATPQDFASLSNFARSEEHTSELQSQFHLVCRLLLEKKKTIINKSYKTLYRTCM